MEADRDQLARELMRSVETADRWLAVADSGSPEWVLEWLRGTIDAYLAGDLEWVLDHTDPNIEIVQPPELPDARSYHGHEGVIEALLDWPREWEDFRVEPRRVFTVADDQVIVQMFLSVEAAEAAARSRA
jgi:ketosteroid isomerase-like protein